MKSKLVGKSKFLVTFGEYLLSIVFGKEWRENMVVVFAFVFECHLLFVCDFVILFGIISEKNRRLKKIQMMTLKLNHFYIYSDDIS